MKTTLATFKSGHPIARVSISVFACVIAAGVAAGAVQLKEARVTQIIKDVKLIGAQGGQRSAAVSDAVREGNAVRTGTDSRAELTFADLTLTRLGSNTIFTFNVGAREVDLAGGAVLLSVPRNGAAVKVITAAVTAAITGGTALFEYHKGMPAKLLVLEGKGEFCSTKHSDECVTVHGGEMAMMTADGRIVQPTKFNAKTVLKTSKLVVGFPPLPNEDLIMEVINEQQAAASDGTSNPPKDPTNIDTLSQATTAAGGSSKFGPPSAITAPNPYHITSGTQINTDPTITTNGVTDTGKIYRGTAQDGPLATWLGTTQSSFDNVDFYDSSGGDGFGNNNGSNENGLPAGGFLFSNLQLDGDPTVSNPNGVKTLALVSQGAITSSGSATFTFSGADRVALVTLNGSIDLSGISFANFGRLDVNARGTGSSVTLGGPGSSTNLDTVRLRAEGDIQVNGPVTAKGTAQNNQGFKALAGNNIVVNAAVTSTGGGITLESLGGINLTNSAQLRTLLDSVGNSGQVVLIASGSDTAINVNGSTIDSAGNEVDIRQTGVAGQTTLNNATIHGDVVKVSALGNNGVLTIGGGMLSADTELKLYANGSNGQLNFISNVTLSSGTAMHLAANTLTIQPGVLVTINGSGGAANVYTNNPNYNFVPGPAYNGPPPNAANGMFTGAGAKDPQPLANAPTLGGPGMGP